MKRWILDSEVDYQAMRSQGPGGQNVNKVATAVRLRFDIAASSLPAEVKARLMHLSDSRIHEGGVVLIKAQNERTQERNKAAAWERLMRLIEAASHVPTPRTPTRPSRAQRLRRLESKSMRSEVKATRGRVRD